MQVKQLKQSFFRPFEWFFWRYRKKWELEHRRTHKLYSKTQRAAYLDCITCQIKASHVLPALKGQAILVHWLDKRVFSIFKTCMGDCGIENRGANSECQKVKKCSTLKSFMKKKTLGSQSQWSEGDDICHQKHFKIWVSGECCPEITLLDIRFKCACIHCGKAVAQ